MKRSRALLYTGILAFIGLFIVILVTYVERSTLNTYQKNVNYLTLGNEVKSRIAKGYRLFQNYQKGSDSVTLNNVFISFTSSKKILEGALHARETEIGKFETITDPKTASLLKTAVNDVEVVIQLMQQQFGLANNTTIVVVPMSRLTDAEITEAFNESYATVQVTMDALTGYIHKTMKDDLQNLSYLSWLSVVLVSVTFTILCFLIYRFQNRSDVLVERNKRQLEEESRRVETLTTFINAVSSGDLSIELETDNNDNLTATLINMRNKLKESAEDERRRTWATTGLAQIGEILRVSTVNVHELYDNIVKYLVKYTKSSQCGLFIVNDDEEKGKHLELVGCYAFERKRYLKKQIGIGEGLVGQCFLEEARIYFVDVPEEYVSITSGLGTAKPTTLLLVPMKINEVVYGVIELASFHPFEEYQIEFVEKLAESIASTVSAVKINNTTRNLLDRTREQAEQMRAQEEEIRQNLEEMEATQEEMRRKQELLEEELEIALIENSRLRNLQQQAEAKHH